MSTPLPKPLTTTLAIVGVVSSSFFTYLSSRNEAAIAKLQSAAGYAAMQVSVKELQDAAYACDLAQAKLEGRLDAIEAIGNARRARAHKPSEPTAAEWAAMPDAGFPAPPPLKLEAPPSLGQAVEQFKETL